MSLVDNDYWLPQWKKRLLMRLKLEGPQEQSELLDIDYRQQSVQTLLYRARGEGLCAREPGTGRWMLTERGRLLLDVWASFQAALKDIMSDEEVSM